MKLEHALNRVTYDFLYYLWIADNGNDTTIELLTICTFKRCGYLLLQELELLTYEQCEYLFRKLYAL